MGYSAGTLKQVMKNVDEVVQEYQKNNSQNKKLIAILVAVRNKINTMTDSASHKETDLRDVLLGAYVLCLENIHSKNSTLRKILIQKLEINETHQISDKLKLVYLQILYSFIADNFFLDANNDGLLGIDDFVCIDEEKEEIDTVEVKRRLVEAMRAALLRLEPGISKLLQATPHEKYIDSHLATLHQDYRNAKEPQEKTQKNSSSSYPILSTMKSYLWSKPPAINEAREFLSQLGTALPVLVPPDPVDENQIGLLPRSKRIKLGMAMYSALSIDGRYVVRSAGNSEFYKLCCGVFAREKVNEYDFGTVYSCLTSFQSFIKDHQVLKALEKYGELSTQLVEQKNYLNNIDARIYPIRKELKQIIHQVVDQKEPANWKATKTLAQVTEMIMKAPFYGTGFFIGYGISKSDPTYHFINAFSTVTKQLGKILLGVSGGRMGFFAAEFITEATSERAFAKIFEKLGKLIGYAAGGVLGLTFDVSVMGLRGLCQLYLYLYSELKDVLISDLEEDLRFIESVFKLPAEVFPQASKDRIEKGLGKNIDPSAMIAFASLEELERQVQSRQKKCS